MAVLLSGCLSPSRRSAEKVATVSVPSDGAYGYDAMKLEIPDLWRAETKYSLSGFSIRSEGGPGIVVRVAYFAKPPKQFLQQIRGTVPHGEIVESNGWTGLVEFPSFKGKLAVGTGFLTGKDGLVAVQIEANEVMYSEDRNAILEMICSVRPDSRTP